jgi:hypothetical protein
MQLRRTFADIMQPPKSRPRSRKGFAGFAFFACVALAATSGCTLDTRGKLKAAVKKGLTGSSEPTAPLAPTLLVVTSKSTSHISLGWSDNSTTETSYELERCAGLGCTSFASVAPLSPLGADSISASDTTISASTYYSYRLRAVSAKGQSAWVVKADIPPAATRLAFATAPSSTSTAGSNFTTQPQVQALDALTDLDTDYSTAVTLTSYTDVGCLTAAGGTLSGATLGTTLGTASFASVKYSATGTIYIKAASGSLTPVCSGAISIIAAPADHLAFTVQPASVGTAGVNLASQPVVQAQDNGGNVDPAYVTNVTIAAYSDSGCLTSVAGTLTGNSASTAAGISNFAGVSFTKSGPLYLKATSGSLTSACSTLSSIVPNSVNSLSYSTVPSSTATAGAALTTQPQVSALDSYSNVVTTYASTITLGSYTDVGCLTANVGTLTGASVAASSGVSTFATVSFDKSGPLYLKAGDGTRTVCSALITVSPAAVNQLVFTTQPTSVATAAANFNTQPTLTARDAYGNTVTGYATTITLGSYSDVGCLTANVGTLNGSATTTAGVAPFSGVNFDKAGSLYIKAGDGTRTVCSSLVTVSPASASKLAFTGQPSATATAGAAFGAQPTVVAQDPSNNTATSYGGSITLSAFTDVGCLTSAVGSLSGTPVTAVSGVSAYSSVAFTKSGTIYLKATSGALTTACSNAVNVVPGAVNTLAFSTQPTSVATAGANFNTQPIVSALDANLNVATAYASAVTLTAHTDVGCLTSAVGTLSGSPITAVSGVSTYTTVSFTKSGTIYLKADDGTRSVCSSAITVNPGATTQLAFTTQPSTTAAANASFVQQPVITSRDAQGNTTPAYAASVTLSAYTDAACTTAAGGTLSNPSIAPASGLLNFSGVKYSAAATIYLKGTDGTLTSDCSTGITVSISPLAYLVFTTQPTSVATAGVNFNTQPIVQAQDSGFALIPSFNGALTLAAYNDVGCLTAASGGTLNGSSVSASSGNATFAGVNFSKSGTYYLRVTDGSVTGCSSAITVAPAALSQIAFTQAPSATNTAAANFATQPVVKGQDTYGNTIPGYVSSVTLSAFTDVGCLTAASGTLTGSPVSAVSGSATFSTVSFSSVGSFYLKANDGTRNTCSSAWNVVAAGASQLAFTGQPSSTNTAGQSFPTSPTVVAQDPSNNTATSYSGLVTISAFTDVGCLTAATGTLSNGTLSATSGVIAYSNVSFTKSGTFYLRASASGLTSACSNSFTVVPDSVTQLAFTTAASNTNTAGANLATQPVLAAQDTHGNTNTSFTTSMTLSAYTDVGCLTAAGGTLNNNTHSTASGVSAFANVNYTGVGTVYFKGTSGAVSSACSAALSFSPGSATQLVFTTAPSTVNTAAANLATQPVIEARDGSNNLTSAYTTAMTISAFTDVGCLTAAGGTLNNRTATPGGGIGTFASMNYTGVGTVYFKATSGGIASSCSSALSFTAGAVTQLAFTTNPSTTNTATSPPAESPAARTPHPDSRRAPPRAARPHSTPSPATRAPAPAESRRSTRPAPRPDADAREPPPPAPAPARRRQAARSSGIATGAQP